MLKTTSVAMLLFLAVATSCKKESITNDFILNTEIDRKLSPENVVKLSNSEIINIANQKFEVLDRIHKTYPNMTIEQLYPNLDFNTDKTANRTDCPGQLSSMKTTCNIVYIGSAAISAGFGFMVGMLAPPVGVAIGATGLAVNTVNYKVCINTAIGVYDNCIKDQR